MPAAVADVSAGTSAMLPPGTVLLRELGAPAGQQIILQPRPTDDPNDPLNWSRYRKYLNFALAGFYVIMASEVINVATPTWGPMHTQLGFSYEALNDSYAAGCAATAVGAILLVPFAHKFGRRPLYLFSTVVQFAVSIWSAKMQTVADLMLVNVLSCAFAAPAEVIVQMTIADIFFVHERGAMNSMYIWFWNIPVTFGPLIAGYITSGQGWRWVWWWNAIFFGLSIFMVGFGYEETKYAPSLASASSLQPGDAQRNLPPGTIHDEMSKESPETLDKSPSVAKQQEDYPRYDIHAIHINPLIPRKTYWQRMAMITTSEDDDGLYALIRHVYQPLVLLSTIPAIAYAALVYGVLVALGDVMGTTLSTFMPQPPYNFTSNQIGLMSLPMFIGITIGSAFGGIINDRLVVYLSHRNGGVFEPEQRLWCMVPFIPLIPTGAILFGIGLNRGLSWQVIAVALGIYKAGVAQINAIILTYVTDSYKDIIGDAMVSITVTRNVISTIFIFALTPWISAIGIEDVVISIVSITSAILMCLGVFIKWGKNFRRRSAARYFRYAGQQYTRRDIGE